VQRAGGLPGQLLQPLGGPAGGRGQFDGELAGAGQRDQGGHRGALAGTRAAGEHADPGGRGGDHCRPLRLVEPLGVSGRLLRGGDRLGGGLQAVQVFGDGVLGHGQPGRGQSGGAFEHPAVLDRGPDRAVRVGEAEPGQRLADHVRLGDGVAVAGSPVQHVAGQRRAAAGVVAGRPGVRHRQGEPVGGVRADPRQLQGEPRVRLQLLPGEPAQHGDGGGGQPFRQPAADQHLGGRRRRVVAFLRRQRCRASG
jgi:hypothetical protein